MSSTVAIEITTAQPEAQPISLKTGLKKLLNFDKDGKPTYQVPSFSDKLQERKWAKEQVAGAFRVFARLGYADGGAGHISLRGKAGLQWCRRCMSTDNWCRSCEPSSFLDQ